MARKLPKIIIPDDLTFHNVKIPGVKGINLSRPSAKDGLAALEYFIDVRERLLAEGVPYEEASKTAFYDARIRFGKEELIMAVFLGCGQEPFKRALEEGKLYRLRGSEYAKASEEEREEIDRG